MFPFAPGACILRTMAARLSPRPVIWDGPGTQFPRVGMPNWGGPFDPFAGPPAQHVPSGQEIPPGQLRPELTLSGQNPPWQMPPYWGKPLDETFFCGTGPTWYDTWTTVQTMLVPEPWMYVIRAIGYEWGPPGAPAIPLHEIFEFQLLREGTEMCRWEDCRIGAAVNPAYQYALGGPQQMIPTPCIIDRNQTLVLRVRVRGQEVAGAFPMTSSDPLAYPAPLYTTIYGWRAPRLDARDGAPQTSDQYGPNEAPDLSISKPRPLGGRYSPPPYGENV